MATWQARRGGDALPHEPTGVDQEAGAGAFGQTVFAEVANLLAESRQGREP